MIAPRKIFISLSILVLVSTVVGIFTLTAMEYQARVALPPEEQSAEIIATVYDGAVCLGGDYGRVFFAMFGSASFVAILAVWTVYEAGRVVRGRIATPK